MEKRGKGRPATDDYTKKILRFSAIEKASREVIDLMENDIDRKAAESFFKQLKERVI